MPTFTPRWSRVLPTRLRLALGERRAPPFAAIANSGWLLFDRLVRAVLGLLVGAWVARHLGPSQFGLLAYVLAYIAMFQAFATLGADSIVVRDIAHSPHQAAELLGSTFTLRAGAGLACWLTAIAGSMLFGGDRQTVVLTAVIGAGLLFQAGDVFDLWFQSQSQSKRTVRAKLVAHLFSNGLKIVLILSDATLMAFAIVTTLEAASGAVALGVAYRRSGASLRWRSSRSGMARLMAQSWPLMLSGFAIMVYMRVDQLLVKELLGPHELGLYAAVLPISQLWQALPMALSVSLAPFLARQKLANPAEYTRSLVLTFRGFFYAGVVAAGLTTLFADLLVHLFFGSQFQAAGKVLAIHSISNVFCFLGIAHSLWLTNEGKFSVRLYGTLLAGAMTISLNVALLPSMGLVAAAWAAVAAQCLAAFLINRVLDRRGFELQLAAIAFRKV